MGQSRDPGWTTDLLVQGQAVSLKMDTGAEVTVISEKDYQSLRGVKQEPPVLKLHGPARQALDTIGQIKVKLTAANTSASTTEYMYIVSNLKANLLGLPTVTALGLVARVDSTTPTGINAPDLEAQYPSLFTGLGTVGGEYHIKLREDAKPHALFALQNVPIPMRGKVEDELHWMEQLEVNAPVFRDGSYPKKFGLHQICVDLKPLNESILRETHPMPSVDDTLAQLSEATVCSKVDMNSGFWQIPLAKESCHLTTFITPVGRICFKKLPFGISSTPELFQKRMSQILAGLKGVICYIDGVFIFCSNQAEHDDQLRAVLNCLVKMGDTQ